jgi:hypothetical protein
VDNGVLWAGGDGRTCGGRATGSWLRTGELSSLLGGVLKGDMRASKEGLRASGWRILAAGRVMTFGLSGILGFSARLTGGGGGLGFSSCTSMPLCMSPGVFVVSDPSTLGARGTGVEERLECWDISSRTLPNGVLSTRSGDLELLRSKKVRGGDRGESTLTEGVSWGEDCNSIDIGRLCPGFGGDSVPLVGVLVPPLLMLPAAPDHGEIGRGISNEARCGGAGLVLSTGLSACGEEGMLPGAGWLTLRPSK